MSCVVQGESNVTEVGRLEGEGEAEVEAGAL